MKPKTGTLQLVAIFCIYLIINLSISSVSALTITHTLPDEVTVDGNTVTIEWQTDELAESRINFGNATNLTQDSFDTNLEQNHSITLTGLLYDTLYYYELVSTNLTGGMTVDNYSGNFYTFVTGTQDDTSVPTVGMNFTTPTNRRFYEFSGTSEPNAFIFLFVNPGPETTIGPLGYDTFTSADDAGIFRFYNVRLLEGDNRIVIFAIDSAGNSDQDEFNVMLDSIFPEVRMNKLPTVSNTSDITFQGTVNEDVILTITIGNDTREEEITVGNTSKAGNFSVDLSLEEGQNELFIKFSDVAGNTKEYYHEIYLDTEPPEIRDDNLDVLSPSYIQEVTIKGYTEPFATVVVYVNNQTSADSSWSTSLMDNIKHLGMIVQGQKSYLTVADKEGFFEVDVLLTQQIFHEPAQVSPGLAPVGGNESGTYTTYDPSRPTAPAGSVDSETEYRNHIKIVAIDKVGQTGEKEGEIVFAKCGYGSDWNIIISDVSPGVITPEHLRLGIAQFGFSVELEWQGFEGEKPPVIRSNEIRRYQLSDSVRENLAFDPEDIMPRSVQGVSWSNDNRKGYVVVPLNAYDYKQANVSDLTLKNLTIKLPMQILINYDYELFGESQTGVQKQCWDVSLLLDVQIPPDTIPKELLNWSIQWINTTINLIDAILDPLNKASVIVFVTCLSSWVLVFFAAIRERFDCAGMTKVGSIRVPEDQCAKDTARCDQCQQSIDSRRKVEKLMKFVCDREFCPAAPTVTYFAETNPDICQGKNIRYYEELTSFDQIGDMAANPKGSEECIVRYKEEWDSACLLMDEFKQSKCVEIPGSEYCGTGIKSVLNKMGDFCEKRTERDNRVVGYRGNDFVENDDGEWCLADVTEVRRIEDDRDRLATKEEYLSSINEDTCGFRTYGSRGHAYQLQSYRSLEDETTIDGINVKPIGTPPGGGEPNAFIDENGNTYLTQPGSDNKPSLVSRDLNDPSLAGSWRPDDKFFIDSGTGEPDWAMSEREERSGYIETPREIRDDINTARNYVVNPTTGLIRSVQCVCLPAITGYLTLWRTILEQVKLCFETILTTGEGKSGICRAVLTVYVCDLIFDAIRCFVKRYSSGGTGTTRQTGISGFFRAISEGGNTVKQSITGRYGKTGLYNTLFNERKVIHQVCLAAFTGDWDIDLEAMLSGAGAIPINSEGFLYPHTRRFMTSNPQQEGRATFIYHIGVGLVAGADVRYSIVLTCSNDYSCDPSEGFMGGRCDCVDRESQTYPVTSALATGIGRGMSGASGYLPAGEFIGVEEGDLYVPISQPFRYDKARLQWTYVDNTGKTITDFVEKKITPIGGKPPLTCGFDIGSLSYHCEYDVGDTGYAIFIEEPRLRKDIYTVGDTVYLDYRIDKKSPGYDSATGAGVNDPQLTIPKYIVWELKDKSSNKIIEGPRQYVLARDGIYTNDDLSIPGIKVTAEKIMGRKIDSCKNTPGWDITVNCGGASNKEAVKVIRKSGKFYYVEGTWNQKGETQFNPRATGLPSTTGSVTGTASGEAAATGGTPSPSTGGIPAPTPTGSTPAPATTTTPTSTTDTSAFEKTCRYDGNKIICGKFSFIVSQPPATQPSEGSTIYIYYLTDVVSGEDSESECRDITSRNPREWELTIGLYHAKASDENYDVSASNAVIDHTNLIVYGTKKQEHKVIIKVACEAQEIRGGICDQGKIVHEDCTCHISNDRSKPGIVCSKNQVCYNYFDDQNPCRDYRQCSTTEKNTRLCDCDGDEKMAINECEDKYCGGSNYVNREGFDRYGCSNQKPTAGSTTTTPPAATT